MAIKIRKKKSSSDSDKGKDDLPVEGVAEPDAFVETSLGFTKWLQDNWKLVAIGIGLIAAAGIGYSLYQHSVESEKVEASASLNEAANAYSTPTSQEIEMQLMQLRMQGSQVADIEFQRQFDDSTARSEAVLAAATNTIQTYGDSEVVDEAHLVAGAAAHRLGKGDEFSSHVQEAGASDDQNLAVFTLQAKAVAQIEKDDLDGAIESYESLRSQAKHYEPFALMRLGQLHEWKGNTEDAANAYAELAALYPNDPQSMQARQRLGMLVSDSQERINKLMPAPEEGNAAGDEAPAE